MVVFLYSRMACAQSPAIKWYTTDDGLPQNSIKDIVKDKYGFLWLSTENGLSRFDGASFELYNNLVMDSKGFYTIHGNVNTDSLYAYSDDAERNLLINNRSPSIFKGEKRKIKRGKHSYLDMVNNSFNSFYKDIAKTTSVFLKTRSGNLYLRNDSLWFEKRGAKKLKFISTGFLKDMILKTIIINGEPFYIDETSKKVWQFTAAGTTPISVEPSFFTSENNTYWNSLNNQCFIISTDGVYLVQRKNNRLTRKFLCRVPDFSSLNVHCLYYDDYFQTLYIGSAVKGLGILPIKHFSATKSATSLLAAVYYAHIPFGSNSVITPDGQILSSSGHFKQYGSGHYLDYYDKRDIIKNADLSYCVLRKSRLNCFKIQDNARTQLIPRKDTDKEFLVLFDLGDFFAATVRKSQSSPKSNQQILLYFFEGRNFDKVSDAFELTIGVNSIIKLPNNQFLLGSQKGLYLLDKNNKEKRQIKDTQHLNIKSITKSSKGNIYILTNGQGFFCLKNSRLIQLPIDNIKALANAHCILEDKKNNFWISTNNGLFKVPEQELLLHISNPNKKVYYYTFTSSNGFNTNEFNGTCNPCGNKLESGQFTFPSMDGIVFFDPEKVPVYYPKKELFVERFKIDGEQITFFDKVINLKNNFFRATIYPEVAYFANQDNLYVEAYLKGKSNLWERVNTKKGYDITQLNHGIYRLTFRVLVSPNSKFIYKTISIEVEPLFYQTAIFRILIVLLLISSLLIIYKLRTQYLVKRNQKLELLVNEKTNFLTQSLAKIEEVKYNLSKETSQQKKLIGTIGHDIATPLKYISIIAKKLVKLSDEDLTKNRNLILSLQNSSEELYTFTNALKDYANLYNQNIEKPFESFDLYVSIEEKINLFDEIAGSKSITFVNNIQKNTIVYTNQIVLKMALHNIIDNAIKYTDAGSITLNFETLNNVFYIHIIDTGIGMNDNLIAYYEALQINDNPDKLSLQKFGIGLHMVIQLLPIINGSLHFQKNKPRGTMVTIEILFKQL